MKKLINVIEKNGKWLLLLLCLVIFFIICKDVFTCKIMNYDVIGYGMISKYLISDTLTPFVKWITWFGSATALILITLFIIIKNKQVGFLVGCNLIIITILNQVLKLIIQRPRPDEYRIIDASGYSFPSGHSMISMAFYGFIIYLICKYVNNKILKYFLIGLLGSLIILIGVSRVYLGVHYVSDVIAGFIISIAYLILFTEIVDRFMTKNYN